VRRSCQGRALCCGMPGVRVDAAVCCEQAVQHTRSLALSVIAHASPVSLFRFLMPAKQTPVPVVASGALSKLHSLRAVSALLVCRVDPAVMERLAVVAAGERSQGSVVAGGGSSTAGAVAAPFAAAAAAASAKTVATDGACHSGSSLLISAASRSGIPWLPR
jgi:hypothetical protein